MDNILTDMPMTKSESGYNEEVLRRLDIFFNNFIEKNGETMPSEMMRKSAFQYSSEDISDLIDQKVFEIKTRWKDHPEKINFSNVAPLWDDQSYAQSYQAILNYLDTVDLSDMTEQRAIGQIMKASKGTTNPNAALQAIREYRAKNAE